MQPFSLTCHLYPKLLGCVFQADPSICPFPSCRSSVSCMRWPLVSGSAGRAAHLAALQCILGQRSKANAYFWNHVQLPSTLLWARTRFLSVSWLLPAFLASSSSCAWGSGTPPTLLQIPSPQGLWIYRSLAKGCLIHSLPHPCKHAGQVRWLFIKYFKPFYLLVSDRCKSRSFYYAVTVGSKLSHCSSKFKNPLLSTLRLFLHALQQDQHSKQSSALPRLFLMENVRPNTRVGGWGLGTIQRSWRFPSKANLWYEIFFWRWPRDQSWASQKHKTQQWPPWPQKATQKVEEITEAGDFFYFFASENI